MTRSIRTAAAAVLLLLAAALPAAAQESADVRESAPAPSASMAAPTWDARLTPAPATARETRMSAAMPHQVTGVTLIAVGAATMYATRQMEGEDGEDGVPLFPFLTGTMGALSFWYGVYKLFRE
ncbi:hypothetical protein [Longimicrobium sp.]|uniref:hypothetical protein n=1 Tax=Longimicrobium sp. TaxID=2029185 RepID=UPI002E32FDA1|nr:hypothetical protein [Longimicrobium sp.]HEX6039076.1 hypothetical protein [Longimicrobium sp.]